MTDEAMRLREALEIAKWGLEEREPENDPNGYAYAILEVNGALNYAPQPTGRTDSERLDWLSRQDINIGRIGKDDSDVWEFVSIEHYAPTWPHPTDDLRDAIDAARAKEQP